LYEFGNIGSLDLTNAKRLRWLRVGNKDRRNNTQYVNTKLTALVLSACESLEYLDLTGCEGFGTGTGQNGIYTLDLSNQTLLQELHCGGATMSGITFPETPSLHTIHIGDNISRLRLVNLSGLTNFEMDGGEKITSVIMRNCGDVAKTQSYDILVNIISNENNVLSDVEIDDIDWKDASAEIVEMLCDKKAKLKGKINIVGANKVTFELKRKLKEQYGDIDNEANGLYVSYVTRAINEVTMLPKQYFTEVGEYQLSFEVDSPYANNYTRIEWSLASNLYATIDSETGVVTVNRMGEEVDGTGPNADATVTIYLMDGTSVSASSNLNFWIREVRVGDIVYHDGTVTSPNDHAAMLAANKVAIGICFYINPYNKKERLMSSLVNVSSNQYWGIYSSVSVNLEDNPDLSYVNIKDIPNLASPSGSYTGLRDEINGDPDGWKYFDPLSNTLGQLGWMTVETPVGRFKKGDRVPYGQYYTECVIDARNKVLSDSAYKLPIPTKTNVITETNSLTSLLSQVNASLGTTYKTLYYPAVSYAYAYCPTTREDLKEEYKEHNWWMPSMGELARIAYYHHESVFFAGSEYDIFTPAINNKVMARYSNNAHYLTSNEATADSVQILALATATANRFYTATNAKSAATRPALAVCAF
jgi:hypothetical protein